MHRLIWGSHLVLAAAVALFVGDTPVAEACSCGLGSYVSPADGAVGVPRTVEIAVRRASPDFIPVLRDAEGNAVSVSERSAQGFIFADWVMLRPDQPLDPQTLYQVDYGETTTTFTTGKGYGIRLPEAAPISNLSMASAPFDGTCSNSCSPAEPVARTADLRYQPSEGIAYYELVFTTPTDSWRRIVAPGWSARMNNSVCGYQPPQFSPNEVWCAELVAVATTGEKVRAESPYCTEVAGCAELQCDGTGEACLSPDFDPGPTVPFEDIDRTPDLSGGCSTTNRGHDGELVSLLLLGLAWCRCRRRR